MKKVEFVCDIQILMIFINFNLWEKSEIIYKSYKINFEIGYFSFLTLIKNNIIGGVAVCNVPFILFYGIIIDIMTSLRNSTSLKRSVNPNFGGHLFMNIRHWKHFTKSEIYITLHKPAYFNSTKFIYVFLLN